MASTTIPSATPATAPRIRRADKRFLRLLLLTGILYVLSAIFFFLAPALPAASGRFLLWAIALLFLLTIPLSGILALPWHRPFKHAIVRQTNTDALFAMAWLLLTVSASQLSGFWNVPRPGDRFFLTALVAAIPLLLLALATTNHGMASRRGWRKRRMKAPLPPAAPPAS